MTTSNQLNKLGVAYDDIYPMSIDIIKRLLVEDENWDILERTLKNTFKELYNCRLMDKQLLDIEVYCDSPTDEERLRINMIFENPDGEPRIDPWKDQPSQ